MKLSWDFHLTGSGFRSGVLWQRCTVKRLVSSNLAKPGDEFVRSCIVTSCNLLCRSSSHMPNTVYFAQFWQ